MSIPFQPIEQATVTFYDREIIAARLTDGRVAASLRAMCDALQLERYSQVRRIRDDDTLADQLLPVTVETSSGVQVMEMLTAWAIPTWLTGIQLSRVAPAKREAIRAFKREAADVLYRHFSQPRLPIAAQPPADLVPAEPIERPSAPPVDAAPAEWIDYHQRMIAFLQWQQDIEQWRGSVESRLESVEEVARLVPELIERLGPATLTPEHQATVRNSVKRLHQLTGIGFATYYSDLNTAFHVAKYEQIAESAWEQVSTWLQTRLQAAQAQAERARRNP